MADLENVHSLLTFEHSSPAPKPGVITDSRFWRVRETGVVGEKPSSHVEIDRNSAHVRSQRWKALM